MEKKLELGTYGAYLWTRDRAREIRADLSALLDGLDIGGAVVIDATKVEVFDYSFANELFGKTLLSLPHEYPGRFLIVEHLTDYAQENLAKALESLNLIMIQRQSGELRLLGKVHPADQETFEAILEASEPVSASVLRDQLGANLNAVNERLAKLTDLALVRRDRGKSAAGREQYLYRVLA